MSRATNKPIYKLSLYRKTVIQMILAIMAIFLILAFVYFLLFTRARLDQNEQQLLTTAEAIAERVASGMDDAHVRLVSPAERGYLAFTARSSGAIVWLVNSEGQVIFYSAMPVSSRQKLKELADDDTLKLSSEWLNTSTIHGRGMIELDNYHDLLPADQKWLTASYPIDSPVGYGGEVLLHLSLGEHYLLGFFKEESIWISFAIAFIFALLIMGVISRNVTKPIAKIVRTAEDVYHGDLSARVKLKGEEVPLMIEDIHESSEDDLTLLVRTMNTLISKWEKQEHERQEFMSSISHDLRTPLTSIRGFISAMKDGTVPTERYPYFLEIVHQEVERLQKLIAALFETTLYDSTQLLKPTVFNFRLMLEDVLNALESLILDRRILIEIEDLPEGVSDAVVGDRDALYRVVYNIISNAIRFVGDEGTIRITIKAMNQSQLKIVIEDDGPGIPEADLPHVFDRFYKVNKSRGSDGSGLGLYIARSILALHEQRIQADNGTLGGASFSFTLERPHGRKV